MYQIGTIKVLLVPSASLRSVVLNSLADIYQRAAGFGVTCAHSKRYMSHMGCTYLGPYSPRANISFPGMTRTPPSPARQPLASVRGRGNLGDFASRLEALGGAPLRTRQSSATGFRDLRNFAKFLKKNLQRKFFHDWVLGYGLKNHLPSSSVLVLMAAVCLKYCPHSSYATCMI